MFKLTTVVLLYMFCQVLADNKPGKNATDVPPETTPTTSKPTKSTKPTRTTTASALHVTKTKKKGPCVGWCLHDKKLTTKVPNLKTNSTADHILIEKFAKMNADVHEHPQFSVRVGMNVFADKNQYADRLPDRDMAQIFDKNVLKIPTTLFYPYTRQVLGDLAADNGNLFVPEKSIKRPSTSMDDITQSRKVLLKDADLVFHNRYFESNPLLYLDKKAEKKRQLQSRRELKSRRGFEHSYNRDVTKSQHESLKDEGDYRRSDQPIQVKVADLLQFKANNFKLRTNLVQKVRETDGILGNVPMEDTILEDTEHIVDDIVGGMRIGGKDATFLIGKTNEGRTKLNQWVGAKDRGKTLPNEKGTGLYLTGKTRTMAIDGLLKSMIRNYQYGKKSFVYRKVES